MRMLTFVLAAIGGILLSSSRSSAGGVDQCLTCHRSQGDAPSSQFRHDVHFQHGITCAGCHGGNPAAADMEQAMDTAAGFRGVPKGDGISRACARCHGDPNVMAGYGSTLPTDQWEKLQQSVHGALATSGTEQVAQCTSCHGAHGIAARTDPQSRVNPLNVVKTCAGCHSNAALMKTYNPSLPVDQLEKYRTSVHGALNAKGDIKAAECASCHGSHGILRASDLHSRVYRTNLPQTCASCHSNADYMKPYSIPTDQFERFAGSVHGVALLQKNDPGAPSCNSCHGNHGAAPPGVASISNVCGTCHALNAELFSASPHKKVFDAQQLPECATCHENHDIKQATAAMLGATPDAVCTQCHAGDDNPRGLQAAIAMRAVADSLERGEDSAKTLVDRAEQLGMEIGEAKFKLHAVHQASMESRTTVHTFDAGRHRTITIKGLTEAAEVQQLAQEAIGEYYYRRIGLGIATLIITVLAVSLYLYIRRLERKDRTTGKEEQVA